MADQRTMVELLQAPTEGYRDAIVIPAILAENFELKHGLLNLEDLVSKFINQFFPPSKTTNLQNEITNFQQKIEETFSEAWDRFKDLLRACPHHGFTELHQLDTFYNALNPTDQDSLNAAAGVSANTSSSTMACPSEMTALTDVVNAMLSHVKTSHPETIKAISESCVTYDGPHPYYECLAVDGNTFNASVAATTYNQNQGYRPQKDLNYRASNQMGPHGFPPVQNNQNRFNQNQGYNQNRGNNFNQSNQNYQAPPQVGPSIDLSNYMKANDVNMRVMQNQISNMRTKLMKEMDTTLTRQNNAFKNELKNGLTNDIKNLMSNFFQMNAASSLGSGSLPSNTVANPRGDLKAITTRSVQTQAPIDEPVVAPKPKPFIPYPSRANKQKLREKDDNLALKFVEIFKELHFELSFTDALLHMPKFSSMFKSLLNNKEKLFDLAKTPVNENCSAVILKKLPETTWRPQAKFLILCDFSELVECLALADLGASINLMPLSIWKKLSLPELTPTRMILKLADQSTTSPSGITEDVFVKVGKFHFLADFIVVDYVVDLQVPLIPGRPFLRTALGQTSRYSYNDAESVNRIDVIDVSCEEYAQEESASYLEEIEACLTNDSIPPRIDDANFDPEGDSRLLEKLLNDDPSSPLPPKELHFEEIKMIKSSIYDPPELELKDLPSHLEYAFLEGTNKLPVIISKELKDEEKAALLKILMEDDFKPAIQHQRRVNSKIHEVIKKEDIKLLDAGLIYPISDSLWVSPVHCVPKKGGMTVVEMKETELIPTELVTDGLFVIDYRKLNDATRKDHFPDSHFMNQMLENVLAGNEY
ncbi:reverse transcriptase domain-containing protein [Tanacetum coccineum]